MSTYATTEVRGLVKTLLDAAGNPRCTYSEIKNLYEEITNPSYEFCIEFACCEFRCIHENAIWELYVDEIEDITKECYFGAQEIPCWIEIDWEKTAKNVLASDGYGHHFASYDGEEHYGYKSEYYVFRIG